MLAFLPGDGGRAHAEEVLALLRRLPPRGPAPDPPRFPFDAATARRYQADYADRLGLPLEFTNRLGMTFVLVPPGMFLMGSPPGEPGRGGDEGRHQVTLTRAFYLCKHETTNGQFARFVAAERFVTDGEKNGGGNAHDERAVWQHRPGTSWLKPGYAGPFERRDTHPVVHVSHADATAFCAWLGRGYGLPTEAQWEWACRAGTGERFWWGPDEDATGKVANVGDRALKRVHPEWPRTIMAMDDGHAFAAPVGSYRPNAFGLYDMLGNVWELCGTRSGPYPQGPVVDPGDLDVKRGFAVRGGGWSNVAADCRCATRQADPPHFCHSNLGFRVALSLP
jgi:formylglycine-generating enzyme required for sulfatase activity